MAKATKKVVKKVAISAVVKKKRRRPRKRRLTVSSPQQPLVIPLVPKTNEGTSPDHIHISHPGSLTRFGYHIAASKEQRHKALRLAKEKYGTIPVVRMLCALISFNTRDPQAEERLRSDMKFFHKIS